MNDLLMWLKQLLRIDSSHASATPAIDATQLTSAQFEIPVLLVHYFPTKGNLIDRSVTGDVAAPLDVIRTHTRTTTAQVIAALEQGSRFRAYQRPAATPSLHYTVVGSLEFLEPLPTWRKPGHRVLMTDYNAIMARIDARRWVMVEGVKEIWIWGYHGGVIDLWESNMAGPWGDISNSDRDPHDLPVFDRTYTVYHYNYGRGPSEAVEDHMHQIEAVLRHIDPDLFWNKFVGKPGEGRCGWAHYPPNGERDYDWRNRTVVMSDIEDWRPDGGGQKIPINCDRWQGDSLKWFIYWMQSLPGADNGLTYRGRPLTNWWTFIGDFDGAMRARLGLVR
ncbi:MAG TPA: hypothetical protein DCL15_21635 [Chloroflexi bacterium]|nr:hypothetical protein [Chloroflexota bacterium]HHW87015.1 hypothetical protein [Chloroflexota bacterium]